MPDETLENKAFRFGIFQPSVQDFCGLNGLGRRSGKIPRAVSADCHAITEASDVECSRRWQRIRGPRLRDLRQFTDLGHFAPITRVGSFRPESFDPAPRTFSRLKPTHLARWPLSPTPETTDEALIARIAQGDKTAMRVLYGRHHVRVFRFGLRLVRNEQLAEDLISEVFLDVWRQAGRFEGRSAVSTWRRPSGSRRR